jgi:hypothetical protein
MKGTSMNKSNLILHTGASAVERVQLANVITPARTATWVPIAHNRLVDGIIGQLESSHDPSVRNSSGQIVGGIRLRIPRSAVAISALPAPSGPQASRPMPVLQAPRNAAVIAQTAAEVAQTIEGLNHSQDQANLEEWQSWGMGIAGTTEAQRDAIEAAFDHAQERLAIAEAPAAPRRPAHGRE